MPSVLSASTAPLQSVSSLSSSQDECQSTQRKIRSVFRSSRSRSKSPARSTSTTSSGSVYAYATLLRRGARRRMRLDREHEGREFAFEEPVVSVQTYSEAPSLLEVRINTSPLSLGPTVLAPSQPSLDQLSLGESMLPLTTGTNIDDSGSNQSPNAGPWLPLLSRTPNAPRPVPTRRIIDIQYLRPRAPAAHRPEREQGPEPRLHAFQPIDSNSYRYEALGKPMPYGTESDESAKQSFESEKSQLYQHLYHQGGCGNDNGNYAGGSRGIGSLDSGYYTGSLVTDNISVARTSDGQEFCFSSDESEQSPELETDRLDIEETSNDSDSDSSYSHSIQSGEGDDLIGSRKGSLAVRNTEPPSSPGNSIHSSKAVPTTFPLERFNYDSDLGEDS